MDRKKSDFERKFLVLGASGSPYTVKIGEYSRCTCPDFETNNNICKHMYFIVLRILKSKTVRKKNSKNTLKKMFDNIPTFLENDLFVNQKAKNDFQNSGRKIMIVPQKFDDVCPICLEDATKNQTLDYCKYQCGKSVHRDCLNIWIKKTKVQKCLFCCCDWPNDYNDDSGDWSDEYDSESNDLSDDYDSDNSESSN